MKRQSIAKALSKEKEAKTYPELPLFDKVVKLESSENVARYGLGAGVYLDIVEGEEVDYGCLNIYGVVIRTTYREIKKGERAGSVFMSYPQYKAKDGEYKPFVTNYSKSLNAKIGEAIKLHYEGLASSDGFMKIDEDAEELPCN